MPRDRTARINRLANTSLMSRADSAGTLEEKEVKLGYEYNALVIGPKGSRTVHDDPNAPGFNFRTDGEASVIRTGKKFILTGRHTEIHVSNGNLSFHPLADQVASTAANPVTTFVQSGVQQEAAAFLSENGRKALSLLTNLLS